MKDQVLISKILVIAVCMSISASLQIFQEYFFYWRPIFLEEFWRAWTAHWVHVGWIHYALNMFGLACLPFIFPYAKSRYLIILLLLLSPLLSLSFYVLLPDIEAYAGLSGVLHGLYVAIAIYFLKFHQERMFAILVLFLIFTKIIWENSFGSLETAQLIGSPVLVEAHFFGAIWGVVLSIGYIVFLSLKNYQCEKPKN